MTWSSCTHTWDGRCGRLFFLGRSLTQKHFESTLLFNRRLRLLFEALYFALVIGDITVLNILTKEGCLILLWIYRVLIQVLPLKFHLILHSRGFNIFFPRGSLSCNLSILLGFFTFLHTPLSATYLRFRIIFSQGKFTTTTAYKMLILLLLLLLRLRINFYFTAKSSWCHITIVQLVDWRWKFKIL